MITLEEACSIAKKRLTTDTTSIYPVCLDIEKAWVFDWTYKSNPNMIHIGGAGTQIDKETGEVSYFELPNEKNIKLLETAKEVDISTYI